MSELPGPSVAVAVPDLSRRRFLEHLDRPAALEGPGRIDARQLREEREEIVAAAHERMEELLEVWMRLRFCEADEAELHVQENRLGTYFEAPVVEGVRVRSGHGTAFNAVVDNLVAHDEFQTAHPLELVADYLSAEQATRAATWLARHGEARGDDAFGRAARLLTERMAARLSGGTLGGDAWMDAVLGEGQAEGEGLAQAVTYLWRRGYLDEFVGVLLTSEFDRVRQRAMKDIAPLLEGRPPELLDPPRSPGSRGR